ncbi:MAG: hypothetical protein ACI4C0_06325 [Lachnospiraceae bacterium]
MEKFKLSDLIGAGTVSVVQKVSIFMESFLRAPVFEGCTADIPDGYKNFVVNGVAAENDTLKIRVTVF